MAVKKHFELQQVLSYRVELEKVCSQEFTAARQDLDAASDRLQQEKQEAENLAQEFCGRQQHIDSIYEMQLYVDFFARKREELKEQQQRIIELDRILEARREELLQAAKEKKVMERLKDKQQQAFRREQLHKENLLLDEIATQKTGQE